MALMTIIKFCALGPKMYLVASVHWPLVFYGRQFFIWRLIGIVTGLVKYLSDDRIELKLRKTAKKIVNRCQFFRTT